MTVRPIRPTVPVSLGFTADRARILERQEDGPWIYVGLGILNNDGTFNPLLPNDLTGVGTVPVPPFQNGWANAGGTKQRMRFKWLFQGGIEIQGSVAGGAVGTTVFTLPVGPYYRPDDGDLYRTAVDDSGQPIAYLIQVDGQVIRL